MVAARAHLISTSKREVVRQQKLQCPTLSSVETGASRFRVCTAASGTDAAPLKTSLLQDPPRDGGSGIREKGRQKSRDGGVGGS